MRFIARYGALGDPPALAHRARAISGQRHAEPVARGGRRYAVRRRPPHAGERTPARSSRAFELRDASWRVKIDSS